ncbi:MAG: hypothetical protein ACI9LU_001731 [Polaribacter sp.]|jgi:hypothetical protein
MPCSIYERVHPSIQFLQADFWPVGASSELIETNLLSILITEKKGSRWTLYL